MPARWTHRLWLRIWLATIAAIVVVAVIAVAVWRAFFDPTQVMSGTATLASSVAAGLPAADAPAAELQQAIERAHERADADLALFDAGGRRMAQAGRPVPPPRLDEDDSHWVGWHGRPPGAEGERPRMPAYALKLADGRWLVVRRSMRALHRPASPSITFVLIALAVAAGTYPIVRRLTRRLERLQRSVERLGEGDLKARVPVEGDDEVARLAMSFNDAAGRIEKLLEAHRGLLANASHELRSPLARVRMGVELLQSGTRPDIGAEIARDIAELDALIDEILLMSRLDAQAGDTAAARARFEPVDLAAIVADEAQRAGAIASADAATLPGDARLLRRLVRNLLENARRHGAGAPVEATLHARERDLVLAVRDRGPGVPEPERERIFEPFYRAKGASETAGGVGLGLALVRSIARQHGGEVRCMAREGGGSEFVVVLRLA